jgi:hypothetical protein
VAERVFVALQQGLLRASGGNFKRLALFKRCIYFLLTSRSNFKRLIFCFALAA